MCVTSIMCGLVTNCDSAETNAVMTKILTTMFTQYPVFPSKVEIKGWTAGGGYNISQKVDLNHHHHPPPSKNRKGSTKSDHMEMYN